MKRYFKLICRRCNKVVRNEDVVKHMKKYHKELYNKTDKIMEKKE